MVRDLRMIWRALGAVAILSVSIVDTIEAGRLGEGEVATQRGEALAGGSVQDRAGMRLGNVPEDGTERQLGHASRLASVGLLEESRRLLETLLALRLGDEVARSKLEVIQ